MTNSRKKHSTGEVAALIEEIADRIGRGDRSFGLQLPLQSVLEALIETRHVTGLLLLNRISLLLLTSEGGPTRYEYVRNIVETLAPLDSAKDRAALRALAKEIRGEE